MLTVGKDSTYTGKNYTTRGKVKPVNRARTQSLWARILTILRIK